MEASGDFPPGLMNVKKCEFEKDSKPKAIR
jgi:hypothetical protein